MSNPKHVLLVEDSAIARRIISTMLIKLGFEVTHAPDGVEGLACLRRMPLPRIAFVDWNMPRMNGLEFVRKVRGDRSYDSMRVMMITTETDTKHVLQAVDSGADEYLMKPFTIEMLQEKLAIVGLVAGG
jgi:two-component system chemotaxis response regulator CheY